MRLGTILMLSAIGLVILMVVVLVYRRIPKRLKSSYFETKWQQLQSLCKDRTTWPAAVMAADQLLDEALKKRRFKGKSMGERLVAAQRLFTDNDSLWFGHKLRMQLEQQAKTRLRKSDVKAALLGIRQALKDLGAL